MASKTVSTKEGKFSLLKKKLKASKKNTYIFLEEAKKPEAITSGVWGFDYVSAIGGAPKGRMIEFNGAESAGKTTLALLIAVEAQKQGIHVLFLDYEQALDTMYAHSLGLNFDPELLTIERPSCIEEGEEIFNMWMEMGEEILVIQDSLPAMEPRKYLEEPEKRISNPGLASRLQSLFFTSATKRLARTNSTLISLNQMRSNMEISKLPSHMARFTPKDKAAGGKANKHYQSQIFNIAVAGREKETVIDEFTGKESKRDKYLQVRINNVKNKVGRPYRGAIVYLELGGGFDNLRNLIEACEEKGVIKKSGAWFSSDLWDVEKIHGTAKVRDYLRGRTDIVEEMLKKIGWLLEDGTMDLSNTYAKYDTDPLDPDAQFFDDEDDEDTPEASSSSDDGEFVDEDD